MDRALLNSMTAAEQRIIAETSRDAMAGLDESGDRASAWREEDNGRPEEGRVEPSCWCQAAGEARLPVNIAGTDDG